MEIRSLDFINSRPFARRNREFKEKHGSVGILSSLKRVKFPAIRVAQYAYWRVQSTNRMWELNELEAETRFQRLDLNVKVA